MQISLSARLNNRSYLSCVMSVDGTDCYIFKPTPFSSKWYSHKTNGPGLRYEIAVSIFENCINWVKGLFPCGTFNDQRIYNEELSLKLRESEKVVEDGGYSGHEVFSRGLDTYFRRRTRARHETVKRKIKSFRCIGGVFRHKKQLHSI